VHATGPYRRREKKRSIQKKKVSKKERKTLERPVSPSRLEGQPGKEKKRRKEAEKP
jgi:hypothetical protein